MALDTEPRLWPLYEAQVLAQLPEIAAMPDLGAVDPHPAVVSFEAAFCLHLGGGRAAFYNSGTSALAAGLFALDLPIGSEVIVPSHSFRGTVTPLFQFGLVPVLVACDASGSIEPAAVQQAISSRTSAVIINHQWGLPADMVRLCALAQQHSLKLIEDASHAHATRMDGIAVGNFGDVAFFSCGTTKLVSGGLGGVLFSRSSAIFDRALVFGLAKHRCLAEINDATIRPLGRLGVGVNLRGYPLAAHLAHSHMKRLDNIAAAKNRNVAKFESILTELFPMVRPLQRPKRWSEGVWYKLPCRVDEPAVRDRLVQVAVTAGIRLKHCDPPLAQQFAASLDLGAGALSSRRLNFRYVDASDNCGLDDLVLFDTRDMYGEVDWDSCWQRLQRWSQAFHA
ncbi:DegT/DnrJ/EryC1/StrS family aminotransferase [Variovorax sp. ZS18.2.2]|uniref:DegT/DnrJ/EryC1/StrS family aminotransferase n=1 Tax=Variovorax sp. ZS18.2.2 TaxID=2971255 RepID=UPI002150C06D|nr:DegT/DnrJ/EryC1/StrS family aminotransferase [Variovorax sp. ZS18.2.2]MCR6476510.1 DegT/DnrJ/EryC1/StrS family aminotransferase [Variovorax sp. ZS18.2.2]